MDEVDEFGIPIKKTATKKQAVDEFGIPIKKKGSSEPTSQKGAVVSPTRPIQQSTSSDTEPPTRAQASVALGGTTNFVKEISSIDKNLISKEEEEVVPLLNKKFSNYGFTFEETGVGDAMIVKNKKGETIEIDLDPFTTTGEEEGSIKLKRFLSQSKQQEVFQEAKDLFLKPKRSLVEDKKLKQLTDEKRILDPDTSLYDDFLNSQKNTDEERQEAEKIVTDKFNLNGALNITKAVLETSWNLAVPKFLETEGIASTEYDKKANDEFNQYVNYLKIQKQKNPSIEIPKYDPAQIKQRAFEIAVDEELSAKRQTRTNKFMEAVENLGLKDSLLAYDTMNYQTISDQDKQLLEEKSVKELALKESNKRIVELSKQINDLGAKGLNPTPELLNTIKQETEANNEISKAYFKSQEDYYNKNKELGSFEENLDILNRDYGFWQNSYAAVAQVGGHSLRGLLGLADYVASADPLNKVSTLEIREASKNISKKMEEIGASVAKPIEAENISDIRDFSRWLTNSVVIPTTSFVGQVAAGPVGMSSLVGQSVGNKYNDMKDMNDAGQANFNEAQMIGVPLATGSVDAALFIFTGGMLRGAQRVIRSATQAEKNIIGESVFKDLVNKQLHGLAVMEGITISKNAIDKFSGVDPNRGLLDGTKESAAVSIATVGMLNTAPQLVAKINYQFSLDKKAFDASETVNRLETSLKNTSLSEENRSIISDQLTKAKEDLNDILKKQTKNISSLSNEQYQEVIKLNNERVKISEKAKKIREDQSLDKNTKTQLFEGLKKELSGVEGRRRLILENGPTIEIERLNPELAKSLREQATKEIQEENKKQNKINETIPKAEIDKRAMSIHNEKTYATKTIDNLPLNEQDRLKRDALTQLTKELNPEGKEDIVIDNEQITQRAFEIHSKELESMSVKPAEVSPAETKAEEVKPAIESPIELKEGEELVDVKQDKKGNTYTYVSETSKKDGVKTTKFKFNRSDKSSEQRNPAGVDADKVLDKYGYEIPADEIPEGNKVVEINEIREDATRVAATVTFENTESGKRFKSEIVLQPKAKEAKSISPETSSNVANLTQDGEGNYVFYHTSPTTLETIEPNKYGTNPRNVTSAEEKTAIGRVGGVSMYYPAENVAENIVSGNTHMVKIPESQVYDFNADPLNLIKEARAKFEKEFPGQAFTPNDQFAQVTKLAGDRGFKMVVGEWKDTTRAQTTEPLKPIDVKEMEGNKVIKPFKEEFVSNKDKGLKSVIPETKEDKLKKVYEEIYDFKNDKKEYKDVYHLKEDYAKLSQEEITKMIEESNLPKEYKDRYNEALKYEPEQRRTVSIVGESVEVENAPEGNHLNIGLLEGRTDKLMSADDVLSKLPKDVKVISHSEIQGTEPSISVEISRPLTNIEMTKFLEDTKQQAIAQLSDKKGVLYDTKRGTSEGWGEFNPEYFVTQDGKNLTQFKLTEPTKKYTEKAKELAEKVRNTDLPDWLKANIDSGKKQGVDANTMKEALAKAIEKTGELMDKGIEFAEAVKESVKEMVDLLGEDKRVSIEKDFSDYYNSIKEPIIEAPKTTSIKNAVVSAEREAKGKEPIEQREKYSSKVNYEETKAKVDSGEILPRDLASSIVNNPKGVAITSEVSDALAYDRMRLSNEYNKVLKDIVENPNDPTNIIARDRLEKQMEENDQASRYSGTISSHALLARKNVIKQDYSLDRLILRYKAATGGKISDQMRAKFEVMSKKLEEANAKLEQYESKESERLAIKALAEIKKEVRQQKRTESKENLKKEREDLYTKLREIRKEQMSRLSANPLPVEMVPIISKLAKNLIMDGVVTLDGVVDEIHTNLKGIFDDIQKRDIRDALSGYGNFKLPSKDEIDVQLREIKSQGRLISAYEDAQSGKAPLKTGFQREAPSDKVRELQRQVQEMMKQNGITRESLSAESTWKTALDGIKTRLKNQIRDLEKQIATGEKTPKKTGVAYDAEAIALKEQRDSLKKIIEDTEGKREITDEQRVKIAVSAVEKSIAEYERRISERDIAPKEKGVKTPETPELKTLKDIRENLKKEYDQMKEEIDPKKTPEERALASIKTRLNNRAAELQNMLDSGNFEKKKRTPTPLDKEAMELKANVERIKNKVDIEIKKEELKNRTKYEKTLDFISGWRRTMLLTGVKVLGKLQTAAMTRSTISPIEEIIGGVLSKIPGISKISEKAPRQGGGFVAKAELKAISQWWQKATYQDMVEIAKSGKGMLDLLHGKKDDLPPSVLDIFGQLHQALKQPAKRNEYFRSFEKRLAHANRNGIDVTDPMVQLTIGTEAYLDANRAIFMQENIVTQGYKSFLASLERGGNVGKTGAAFAKIILPIVKVPTNYVGEVTSYSGGYAKALPLITKAIFKGVESLSPEQSDYVMRNLKKGSLGAAFIALGYFNAQAIGGYYQRGEKRKEDEVDAGGLRLFGEDMPKWLVHTPLLECLQIGATLKRVQDSYDKKGKEEEAKLAAGLAVAKGLVEEVPFARSPEEALRALGSTKQFKTYTRDLLESMINPQLTKELFDLEILPKIEGKEGKISMEELKVKSPAMYKIIMKLKEGAK